MKVPGLRWHNPHTYLNLSGSEYLPRIIYNSENWQKPNTAFSQSSNLAEDLKHAGSSPAARERAVSNSTDPSREPDYLYFVSFIEKLDLNSKVNIDGKRTRQAKNFDECVCSPFYPPFLSSVSISFSAFLLLFFLPPNAAFLEDVIPLAPLLLTPKNSQVNAWVGQAGVVANVHCKSVFSRPCCFFFFSCCVVVFGSLLP
jgi:hypothetical protein